MVSRLETDPPLPPGGTDGRYVAPPPNGTQVEVEAKFLIDGAGQAGALVDSLKSQVAHPPSRVDIVDCYWDTPDWSLYRAGWAFRWRSASGNKSLTLKSIDGGRDLLHRRQEVEQPGPESPDNLGHSIPDGLISDYLVDFNLTHLRELFRVYNSRRIFDIRTPDKTHVRASVDQVTVSATRPKGETPVDGAAFMELELELVEGREESLLQLAKTMQKRFGLLQSRRGKFDRGLQAASLTPPGSSLTQRGYGNTPYLDELRRSDFSADDPMIHLAYRCFLDEFEGMLEQEPKAWEGLDPEGVHKMRVRIRRLRAAFRAFRDLMPADSVRAFNAELRWVAAALGNVRDLDVYRANLAHYTKGVQDDIAGQDRAYQHHLEVRWRKARKRLLACLGSKRYERLKARFAQFLGRGPSQRVMKTFGDVTVGAAARRLIGKRYKGVLRDGRAITPASSEESLHDLRIQCKRLRYLFEFFDPIYGRAFKPEIRDLKALQDVLGEFQDASVAAQHLRKYVQGMPARDRNGGQLIGVGHVNNGQERQEAIRWDDFPMAWMKFDREGARDSVLTRLVEPVDRCPGEDQAAGAMRRGGGSKQNPAVVRQACVIPFRHLGKEISYCVITSYDNKRWIFPKGFVDGDESLEETGLKEAFEEAGLRGRVLGPPLGRYVYSKWGSVMDVTVLLMEVGRADESWLEDVRLRRWTSGAEALKLIGKPELREMLRRGMRRLSGADGRGGRDNA